MKLGLNKADRQASIFNDQEIFRFRHTGDGLILGIKMNMQLFKNYQLLLKPRHGKRDLTKKPSGSRQEGQPDK